jgi:hypothetical protein
LLYQPANFDGSLSVIRKVVVYYLKIVYPVFVINIFNFINHIAGRPKTNSVAHNEAHGAKVTTIRAASARQQRELPAADFYVSRVKPFVRVVRRIFFKLKVLVSGHRQRVKIFDVGFFGDMLDFPAGSKNNAV